MKIYFIVLLYLYLTSLGLRLKFYFIWTLTESYFYFAGYENIKNIYPMKIETATSIRELSLSWNVYTNFWLKEGVFKSFVKSNKFLAAVLTFSMSAFFHGPNICYLLMFITIALLGNPMYKFNKIIYKLEKYIGWLAVKIILLIQMTFLISYICVPFQTLCIKKTITIWRSVYYYGHIHLSGVVLMYFIY